MRLCPTCCRSENKNQTEKKEGKKRRGGERSASFSQAVLMFTSCFSKAELLSAYTCRQTISYQCRGKTCLFYSAKPQAPPSRDPFSSLLPTRPLSRAGNKFHITTKEFPSPSRDKDHAGCNGAVPIVVGISCRRDVLGCPGAGNSHLPFQMRSVIQAWRITNRDQQMAGH